MQLDLPLDLPRDQHVLQWHFTHELSNRSERPVVVDGIPLLVVDSPAGPRVFSLDMSSLAVRGIGWATPAGIEPFTERAASAIAHIYKYIASASDVEVAP